MTFHSGNKSPQNYVTNLIKEKMSKKIQMRPQSPLLMQCPLAVPRTIMNILTLEYKHEHVRSYFNFTNRLFWVVLTNHKKPAQYRTANISCDIMK